MAGGQIKRRDLLVGEMRSVSRPPGSKMGSEMSSEMGSKIGSEMSSEMGFKIGSEMGSKMGSKMRSGLSDPALTMDRITSGWRTRGVGAEGAALLWCLYPPRSIGRARHNRVQGRGRSPRLARAMAAAAAAAVWALALGLGYSRSRADR